MGGPVIDGRIKIFENLRE